MTYRAVVFDFYGTLAIRQGTPEPVSEVLARFGHVADEAVWQFFNGGIDGTTHMEQSRSREHYMAWQQQRYRALLDRIGVPEQQHDEISDALRASWASGEIVAYPEADSVLGQLRQRGLRLMICSNWDWDLREAVSDAGLALHVEDMISSAWVGARKPHPLIFERTIDLVEVAAEEILFVGDTWSCDVDGPANCGMTPVYIRRRERERDHTRPPGAATDHEFGDLRGLLELS